jgi:hypothetical protein
VGKAVTTWLSSFGHTKLQPSFARGTQVTVAVAVALTIGFLVELYLFAQIQDLWLDESTQLTGSALNLTDMFRWLAGEHLLDPYGVPGDRMPPLSYLIDWAWLRLYGPSELGFRLFHSFFVVAGTIGFSIIVWRNVGAPAGIIVLSFFVLSPKLIQIGTEIRAYPIFFAVSCAQTAVFVTLVADRDKPDVRWLAIFVLICLAAIYTHFYGVVSTCAFFVVLGLAYSRSLGGLIHLVVAGIVVVVASLGILPFVLAGVNRSDVVPEGPETARHLIYLLKLFGDSANVVSITAAVLFFGGVLALLTAASIGILERLRRRRLMPLDWLLAVVIAGVCATVAASFVVTNFSPLTASYSIWLFAPIGALIALGSSLRIKFRPWDNAGRFVAIAMMVIGSALATLLFLLNANMFVHGPHRFVGALYDSVKGPKALVYEAEAYWKFGYFPLVFSYKNEIAQYRAITGDTLLRIERGDGLFGVEAAATNAVAQPIQAAVAPYRTLLIVDLQLRSYRDIRQCRTGSIECRQLTSGGVESALTQGGQWREIKAERMFGLYDTQVKIMEYIGDKSLVTTHP